MRTITFLFGICVFLTASIPFQPMAQEMPPQQFVVFEEFVSPADMHEFARVQDRIFEVWDKNNMDLTIYCYRNDENAFYWVFPISSFASIDTLLEKSMGLQAKMVEEGFDFERDFRDLSTGRQTIIRWIPELSYHPTGKFGQTPEDIFVEFTFCYMRSGHEKEAGEAIKKYIDFYNSIDETYDWDVYTTIMGHDTPMWIVMVRAENELALRKLENDLDEKHGGEFNEMWFEFSKHVRRFENKKGWFLPGWSRNLPE
jgi:hypothetical protein